VQASQRAAGQPNESTADTSDHSTLLRLQHRKKALTVLLKQALIFAHPLQDSLRLAYVFTFLLERDQQRLLFG
jgi:hypothetical protein